MPLRLLQITIPDQEDNEDTEKLLKDLDVLGRWRDEANGNRHVIHLLIPAEQTEPVMDRFQEAYEEADCFRILVFAVEAVLPRPEEVTNGKAKGSEELSEEEAAKAARLSREELYSEITESVCLDRVFIATTILSSIVAAVGLMRDDVAIIIGAMVIAPLLGTNVAMAFASTLGDFPLLRRAALVNVLGLVLAFVIALVVGTFAAVDPSVPSIDARTHLGLGDLTLALAAGTAGTLAFTRGFSGAVIGVMVAVALMPPLVASGMLMGSGHHEAAMGGLLLFTANIVCFNLAGIITFLFQGVRPRTWWEEKDARKASRAAMIAWLVLLVILGVVIYFSETSDAASILKWLPR